MSYQVRRVVISSMKSRWRPVTTSMPQRSMLRSSAVHVFINYLDDGTEHTLSKFVSDTELGRVFDRPGGWAAAQQDLDDWRSEQRGTS